MTKQLSKNQQKLVRDLRKSKKARMKNRCFIVEGLKNVAESIKSNYEVRFVVISDDFIKSNTGFIKTLSKQVSSNRLYQVKGNLFNELTDTVTPQGIMAVVNFKDTNIEDVQKENFLMIALDRIQDPGNMGTIIRTADAAGADAIVIGQECVDIYNPKVVRSAMGSLFHIPIIQTDDLIKTLIELKEKGGKVVTTHLKAKKHYYDINYKVCTVIVMGSEDEGVSKEIVQISDELVKIPMPGSAESLNVAIAHGIMVFEAVKQRIKPVPSTCK